jgi:hypothetical protein
MSASVTSQHTVKGYAAYLRLVDGRSQITDCEQVSEVDERGRPKISYEPTGDKWLTIDQSHPQNSQNRSTP